MCALLALTQRYYHHGMNVWSWVTGAFRGKSHRPLQTATHCRREVVQPIQRPSRNLQEEAHPLQRRLSVHEPGQQMHFYERKHKYHKSNMLAGVWHVTCFAHALQSDSPPGATSSAYTPMGSGA